MNIEVEGGYESEGPFVVGVSSGSKSVGFGASNSFAAMTGRIEYKSIHLSLTADQAREIANALNEHAAKLGSR